MAITSKGIIVVQKNGEEHILSWEFQLGKGIRRHRVDDRLQGHRDRHKETVEDSA